MASIKISQNKKAAKKHKSDKCCNLVNVASVIACYANPTIYVLFSIVYFLIGLSEHHVTAAPLSDWSGCVT